MSRLYSHATQLNTTQQQKQQLAAFGGSCRAASTLSLPNWDLMVSRLFISCGFHAFALKVFPIFLSKGSPCIRFEELPYIAFKGRFMYSIYDKILGS